MQTFATPGPITAILNVPAGRIRFTAADADTTTVEIRPADPFKGRDVKLARQVTAGYSDSILRITAPAGNQILGSSGAVEVTVQLPGGSRVEVKAASTQFTTTGRIGEIILDSSQATVSIDQAAAVRLTTAEGDITVGRLGGDAEIRTAKGDIQVAEASSGTVTLRTETGAISVGAVAGVSATLDAATTLGRIHNALTNAGGTAGLTIHATTTVGDITAQSR